MSRSFRGGQSPLTAERSRKVRFNPTEDELDRLTVPQLRELCEKYRIDYLHKNRKSELIEKLLEWSEV